MALFKKKQIPPKANVNRQHQLRSDFLAMTAQFASHQYVSITQTIGTPPDRYVVLYKVDGLHQTGKSIESKQEHSVEISLPSAYPLDAPVCKSISPVYHPNFSRDIIDVAGFWKKSPSLTALVVHIGNMIIFKEYSTENAINAEAAKWTMRNKEILPLSTVTLELKTIWPDLPKNLQASLPQEKSPLPKPPDNVPPDVYGDDTKAVDQELLLFPKQDIESIVITSPPQEMQKQSTKAKEGENAQLTVEGIVIVESPSTSGETGKLQSVEKAKLDERVAPQVIVESESIQKKPRSQMVLFKFMYCPYCGSKNNKTANFCMNCGSRIKAAKSRNIKQVFSIAAMIVVPMAILLGGFSAVILHAINHIDNASGPVKPVEKTERPSPKNQDSTHASIPPQAIPPQASTQISQTTVTQKLLQKPKALSQPMEFSSRKALSEEQTTKKISELLQNARLYMNIGSYDDAVKRYKEVLKLSPTNFEASMGLDSAEEAREKAPAHSSYEE